MEQIFRYPGKKFVDTFVIQAKNSSTALFQLREFSVGVNAEPVYICYRKGTVFRGQYMMDGSEDGSRGGTDGGERTLLYSSPRSATVAEAEKNAERLRGESHSERKMPRSGTRNRSHRQPVDSPGVHGLSKVFKGAAAFGVLLLSAIAFRFFLCLGAPSFHRATRQGVSSGVPSRRLADRKAPYQTPALSTGARGASRLPGVGCRAFFDSFGFDSQQETVPLLPAARRDPENLPGDMDSGLLGTRRRFRGSMIVTAVLLASLVLALGAAALISAAMERGDTASAYGLTGLAAALFSLLYLKIRRWLFVPPRPEHRQR
ncbi:hypothetical protein CSUI_004832 [Cystoisospora suis]|uniref:Transmembrane protein n=1 Tax=Cystoisospora suis TaxID=483139 RepID=A0A2C6KVX4_9APIC|nr:hypothetical protein CSUI_004832 [Cystoisospora suis]